MYTIIILAALIIFFLATSLRVVKEYDRGVIFFLGKCTGVRGPGLIILIPILEQMTKVTLRTITMDIPSQKIITKEKDNATVVLLHHTKRCREEEDNEYCENHKCVHIDELNC